MRSSTAFTSESELTGREAGRSIHPRLMRGDASCMPVDPESACALYPYAPAARMADAGRYETEEKGPEAGVFGGQVSAQLTIRCARAACRSIR